VKLVLHLSHYNWAARPDHYADVLTDVAGLAEEGGMDGIAVADHVWQHPIMGGPEADLLEAYTTLAYLAARTRSVRLLTVVTGVHFRHPAVLAKTVTSLDVLCGGRAWLGIGTGHYEEECTGLGVPFPPLATRYELLEDALQMCLRLWSGEHGDDGPLDGHHLSATRLLQLPQALQRPHPPILIAGTGARRTLPLVARYGDACSLRPSPAIPDTLDRLRRLCDETGRDFGRIERTCAFAFDPDDGGPHSEQLLEQLGWLAGLGIDTVIGRVDGADPRRAVERLARHVVTAATEIEPRPHTTHGNRP
jgi:alkanesulfonate monooxygenase SsuD/methylene tetrahydromethanopterin reductase-like flavin-dependent oxidoreductase (luciferase family)